MRLPTTAFAALALMSSVAQASESGLPQSWDVAFSTAPYGPACVATVSQIPGGYQIQMFNPFTKIEVTALPFADDQEGLDHVLNSSFAEGC